MMHDVYHILGLRVYGSMDMTAKELNEKCVLGGCLFLDKSGNCIHLSFLNDLVVDDLPINEFSWGSVALAYLYRQLGTASRKDVDSIAGCLTLLQAWIHEYFPCFWPQQGALTRELSIPRASAWDVESGCPNKSMERFLAFRARLDQLTDNEDILRTIVRPEKAKRPTNLKMYRVDFSTEMTSLMWTRFVPGSSFSVVLGALARLGGGAPLVALGYMQWLYRFFHARLSPGGSSDGSTRLPERTNTDYLMGQSMEIHQRALDEYPSMSCETRAMTEQLIVDWKAMMGL
ncbi:uncharacterized protein LOC110717584 [Chenopodium quinoa]|uniref:uncharacterized protein LOC110717584 n=1 Tax=Chenopodium quinoa TaxID=63459 RepID=UPI000B77381A|nr:uncharacterized protein LOC110717584 [Chenopodium quinoa]